MPPSQRTQWILDELESLRQLHAARIKEFLDQPPKNLRTVGLAPAPRTEVTLMTGKGSETLWLGARKDSGVYARNGMDGPVVLVDQGLAEGLARVACPGCGSCAGMFTANTMNCLTEALGMGLPGNGTIPAVDSRRLQLARAAGSAAVKLWEKDIRPRDIVNEDSLTNAFVVDVSLGGSTNSVLHLMAIASEAGISFPLSRVNEISRNTPHLTKMSPAGQNHIEDLDFAGGILL